MRHRFRDRKAAALELAATMLQHYKDKQVIVLGIPRGGAETGYYIASALNAEFSLIICRKLGHRYNPEYALGAIAEDGTVYLYPPAIADMPDEDLDLVIRQKKTEIQQRIKELRKGKPLPDLTGKTVIIADDGIATGATMIAAARMCKKTNAARVVIAAPVASEDRALQLAQEADEVVILQTPPGFFAVSQAYDSFRNLTDEEALYFMDKWEEKKEPSQ